MSRINGYMAPPEALPAGERESQVFVCEWEDGDHEHGPCPHCVLWAPVGTPAEEASGVLFQRHRLN